MTSIYKYISVFTLGLLAGLCLMYAATHKSGPGSPLPSTLASVPSHTRPAVVRVYDKTPAREQGAIGSDVEKDMDKELLAAGQVKGSDGKKTVSAVLDTKTGDTSLIVKQPFAEWVGRHELGIGYGLVDGDPARAAQYRYTFARIWKFYGTVQVEAFQVDRPENRNPWNAVAYLSLRF